MITSGISSNGFCETPFFKVYSNLYDSFPAYEPACEKKNDKKNNKDLK